MNLSSLNADDLPLDFVKQYLRVEHDLDDLEIQVALMSACSYIRTYTQIADNEPLENGLIIPILCLTAHFYENKSPQMKSTDKLDAIFSSILNIHRVGVL